MSRKDKSISEAGREAIEAWGDLIDTIAEEWHIYRLLDWLESKLNRRCDDEDLHSR